MPRSRLRRRQRQWNLLDGAEPDAAFSLRLQCRSLQLGRVGQRPVVEEAAAPAPKDSFNEVDFGSYFQEYLDPGYRTQPEYEDSEKPSFENFLSQPTTLSDHLAWQLGALSLSTELRQAAELVVGNLDEDGYLAASEEELAAAMLHWLPTM